MLYVEQQPLGVVVLEGEAQRVAARLDESPFAHHPVHLRRMVLERHERIVVPIDEESYGQRLGRTLLCGKGLLSSQVVARGMQRSRDVQLGVFRVPLEQLATRGQPLPGFLSRHEAGKLSERSRGPQSANEFWKEWWNEHSDHDACRKQRGNHAYPERKTTHTTPSRTVRVAEDGVGSGALVVRGHAGSLTGRGSNVQIFGGFLRRGCGGQRNRTRRIGNRQ